jgi:hypothetical protein
MPKDHQGSHSENDPNKVDPWVQSQLSAYHVLWLDKQGDVMNKTELLKRCRIWFKIHPLATLPVVFYREILLNGLFLYPISRRPDDATN